MFDNQPSDQNNGPVQRVDDIFSGIDQGAPQGLPNQPQAQFSIENANQGMPIQPSAESGTDQANKRLMVIGGAVLGLLIIAIGVWGALMNIKGRAVPASVTAEEKNTAAGKPVAVPEIPATDVAAEKASLQPAVAGSQAVEPSQSPVATASSSITAGASSTSASIGGDSSSVDSTSSTPAKPTEAGEAQAGQAIPEAVRQAAAAKVDTDNDGLTDDEERQLGLYLDRSDTDNDGLSDYEEVKVYLTNPKNPDTDNDGYKDGDEVKNGYNPSGTGKIIK